MMLSAARCGGGEDPISSEDGTGDEVSGAAGPATGDDAAGERPPVVGYCEGDPAGSPGPDPSLGFQPEVEPTSRRPTATSSPWKFYTEPKIRAYDTAWEFLQGKVKDPGSSRD